MSSLRQEVVAVARHSSIYVVAQAVSRAVGFFMIPIYTRCIAPAGYGAMELIELLAGALGLVVSMGAAEAMSRFYFADSSEAGRRTVVSTLVLGLAGLSLPVVLAAMAAAGWLSTLLLDGPEFTLGMALGLAGVWFGLLCQLGYSYLRMRYQAGRFLLLTTVQLALALAMNVAFLLWLDWGVTGVLLSTLLSQAVVGTWAMTIIVRACGAGVSWPLLKRIVAFGLPMVPAEMGTFFGFMSNRLFLRWMGPADPAVALTQIGLFSLGHKFGVVINRFVNVPFKSFWGPRRLELLAEGSSHAEATLARICTYSTAVAAWAVLLLCAGIEGAIALVADPQYVGAAQVVPLVAATYLLLGLEPHFSTAIVHAGKTKQLTAIGLGSLAVALAWNWFFVPRWGLLGAATSNLAAIGVREALILLAARRIRPLPFEWRRLGTLLAAGAGLYAVAQGIELGTPLATFAARTAVAAAYPAALAATGFFYDEEWRFAAGLIGRAWRRSVPTPACERGTGK